MRLVSELRRRNVFRMAVLYFVAAWLIVQVAGVLIDLADLPDWIGTTTLWLLGIGFPIALIFSWFYEITPEGVSLEKDVDPEASITHVTSRRLDFIVISLLCAAVILFAYDKWWMGGPPEQSIAVLAFENMSDDPSQEYFSDGISEELLNRLSKVPELRVISRTSAFSYKGKELSLVDIARELNVAYILEGSVRKDGNKVRITAQLINASSDARVWSETYNRMLGDIFSIQDEISSVVFKKLEVSLLDSEKSNDETDPDAYALYLQANHLAGLVTTESLRGAVDIYEQVLAIDPEYAPAWLGLATAYIRLGTLRLIPAEEARTKSLDAVEQAIGIAPTSGRAHGLLAYILFTINRDLKAAAHHFELALMYEPTNTEIIGNVALFLEALGRLDESILLTEYTISRDPANAYAHNLLGLAYRYSGQYEKAKQTLLKCLMLNPTFFGANYELGAAMLLDGDYDAAGRAFENEPTAVFGQIGGAMAHYARGEVAESQELLDGLIDGYGERITYYVAMIFAYRDELDEAFRWLERARKADDGELTYIINEPLFKNLHDDARWGEFLVSIGVSPEQLAAIDFDFDVPK